MHRIALPFECASLGTVAHPPVPMLRLGAGRDQQQLHPRFSLGTSNKRKFTVITNVNTDLSKFGVKYPQESAAADAPLLALEASHDPLVLNPHRACGREQPRAVDIAPIRQAAGSAGGQDMHAMTLGEIGVKGICARHKGADRGQRAMQITHRRRIERGQLHRAIFGEHRQCCSPIRRPLDPSGELGPIGLPVRQPVDRILRGGDNEAHSVFIQYCMGLTLSRPSP